MSEAKVIYYFAYLFISELICFAVFSALKMFCKIIKKYF